ncbi:MAG: cytidyltransferase [Pseudomonadota bacterium]
MTERTLAMIPARLGSQRLKKKNLALLDGVPLIAHAVRRCVAAGCFSEIWVNTESDEIGSVAESEGARFHRRPAILADNKATSEDFIAEFFEAHPCSLLVQVHSIAPLLTADEIGRFVNFCTRSDHDVVLSCVHDQIEVAYEDRPVNFTFDEKTNSQDLKPVQRITWAITAWRRAPFLDAVAAGRTATYSGSVGFYPLSPLSGHVIKTQADLDIAAALLPLLMRANKEGHRG